MSSVVVQVGQCGNQVAEELWKLVDKDPACGGSHAYRSGDGGHVRSVLVDSEPKVVQRILSNGASSYRPENVVTARRGRGGNWALGYYGMDLEYESGLLDTTLEAIRRETERCESFSGIVLLHSLCGGTGSGFGSRLMRALRDEFPLSYLMSCAVAPHATGESPLQSYNSLLCLAHLQRYCDATMLFCNDEVLQRLARRSRSPSDHVSVSVSDINQHIAACLAGALLPTDSITPKSGPSLGLEPWELLRSVCPMPALKFMHLNTAAKSKVNWDSLASQVTQSLRKYNYNGHKHSSLALLCSARGDVTGSFWSSSQSVQDKLIAAYNPVKWNPFSVDFWVDNQSMSKVKNISASLTVASNYSNVIDLVADVWTHAQEKYRAGAFLHWYWKHGADQTDFEDAFESVANIAEEYTKATV